MANFIKNVDETGKVYYVNANAEEILNKAETERQYRLDNPEEFPILEISQEEVDEYEAKQYQRDRVYPAIEDQLDNIFHNGVDAWKADIQLIKEAHPKP